MNTLNINMYLIIWYYLYDRNDRSILNKLCWRKKNILNSNDLSVSRIFHLVVHAAPYITNVSSRVINFKKLNSA